MSPPGDLVYIPRGGNMLLLTQRSWNVLFRLIKSLLLGVPPPTPK